MGSHHDPIGLIVAHAEFRLQHRNDKLPWRVIVIDENDLFGRSVFVWTLMRGFVTILLSEPCFGNLQDEGLLGQAQLSLRDGLHIGFIPRGPDGNVGSPASNLIVLVAGCTIDTVPPKSRRDLWPI
jgi:hypothetical protein